MCSLCKSAGNPEGEHDDVLYAGLVMAAAIKHLLMQVFKDRGLSPKDVAAKLGISMEDFHQEFMGDFRTMTIDRVAQFLRVAESEFRGAALSDFGTAKEEVRRNEARRVGREELTIKTSAVGDQKAVTPPKARLKLGPADRAPAPAIDPVRPTWPTLKGPDTPS
jgi:hypothetical protein